MATPVSCPSQLLAPSFPSKWSLCFPCNKPLSCPWCCWDACFLLPFKLLSLTFSLQPQCSSDNLSRFSVCSDFTQNTKSLLTNLCLLSKWCLSAAFNENASILTFIRNTPKSFPVLTFYDHISFHWLMRHTGLHVSPSWFLCLSLQHSLFLVIILPFFWFKIWHLWHFSFFSLESNQNCKSQYYPSCFRAFLELVCTKLYTLFQACTKCHILISNWK